MVVSLMPSKKVPKVVSNFVLYRTTWNDVYFREKSAGFIILGQTGSGKSWLGLKIANDLDPTFAANLEKRIVYTAEEFIQLVAYGNLKRGNVVIFDELGHAEGADSRASMSRSNRLLSGVVSTYRQMGLIVIWILPTLTQLDKNIRMVSITGYFKILGIDYKRKQTRVSYYANSLNPVYGKSYYKMPVMKSGDRVVKVKSFRFNAPPKDLAKAYKKRKMEFVSYIAKKAADENKPEVVVSSKLNSKDLAKQLIEIKDKFIVNGKIQTTKVMAHFDLGRDKASVVSAIASNELGL